MATTTGLGPPPHDVPMAGNTAETAYLIRHRDQLGQATAPRSRPFSR